MIRLDYNTLLAHVGHHIEIEAEEDSLNISICCKDCAVILLDFDRDEIVLETSAGEILRAVTGEY